MQAHLSQGSRGLHARLPRRHPRADPAACRTVANAAAPRRRAFSPDGRKPGDAVGPPLQQSSPAAAAKAAQRPSVAASALGTAFSQGVKISSRSIDDDFPLGDRSSEGPQRKTKIVCTIGPTSWSREALFQLAAEGMNVVRLNMSHGTHESHRAVVDLVREYNAQGPNHALAIMLDTKGPEVRSGDLAEPLELGPGDEVTFTIVEGADGSGHRISVNYDDFVSDVSVGDILLIDGGIMSMQITSKTATDVVTKTIDGGTMKSRRHLNIRGKSANLPAITDKDWADLQFGVDVGVDYYALSFVRDAEVIHELKAWLAEQGASIGVLAKIESADSVEHLDEILDAVDGAMVARGDLGAELPVEEVPYWQNLIVQGCRKRGKPVIVATNMLESMIQNPTPTRAEVSDIAIAVREGTDAVMLSGETAHGRFPFRSVEVMASVARRTELAMLKYQGVRRYGSDETPPIDWVIPPGRRLNSLADAGLSEMFAYHAVSMANTIKTSLVVFTRKGNMPALLSHYRPDFPIYCFTEKEEIQRRLALYHGVVPLHTHFSDRAEETFERAINELKERGLVKGGQLLAIVQSGRQAIWRATSTHSLQVRAVPKDRHVSSDSDNER